MNNSDVIETLHRFSCIMQYDPCNFRVFSVLERNENEYYNEEAGLDLVDLLYLNFAEYNFQILLYSKDFQAAKQKVSMRKTREEYRITSDLNEVFKFCCFNDNLNELA